MLKITELTEKKLLTVYVKDIFGNRHREEKEYIAIRKVKTVKTGPRFAHYLIDLIILYVIILLFSFVNSVLIGILSAVNPFLADQLSKFLLISLLLLYPLYFFSFEAIFQTTIGKMVTQSVVIDEYGNKPSIRAILLRSICRIVPFDYISCLGDEYSYGWHDKWSNTWVVTKSELIEIRRRQAEQLETINP